MCGCIEITFRVIKSLRKNIANLFCVFFGCLFKKKNYIKVTTNVCDSHKQFFVSPQAFTEPYTVF